MVTCRVEIQVRDYDMWRQAFARDSGGREKAGMRRYEIFRPVDDAHCVIIDGEFDRAEQAEAFLEIMRTRVWPDPSKAPAKMGAAQTRIIELVESHDY